MDSVIKIVEKLKQRSVTVVGELFGSDASWQREELLGCLNTLELKKTPLSYIVALETAVGSAVGTPPALQFTTAAVKPVSGGNMSDRCTKRPPSRAFNPRNWRPDARVFAGLPTIGEVHFLPSDKEKLYLDKLWLCAMIFGEQSLGDYLPQGMAGHLGRLHDALLPQFKPKHFGKVNQVPRPAAEVIGRRFMNGRFQKYPRIVLDQQYRHLFDEKAQNALRDSFVDATDERLATSELNNFLATIVEVYSGNAPEQALIFPGEQSSEVNTAAAPRAEPKAAAAPPRSTANVTVPAAEPLPTAPAAVEDADLDGLELGQGAGALPEPPKAKPLAAARAPPAVSKKDAQKAKRAAGVGSAKRAIAADSSDEEDSSGAESEGEGEGAAAADGPSRPPAKQTPRAAAPARATPKTSKEGAKRPSKKRNLQQLKLQFKIPIGPVAKGAALLTDPAVEPPLDARNVVSRFVYVPPSVWPGLSEYGWVAKVKSIHMHRPQTCMLLFHDDTVPFALETVLKFKPVS